MDTVTEPFDDLIRSAARRLKGHQRRLFMAEVATRLCEGSARGLLPKKRSMCYESL